jgi:anti-sigma factor (TIGR02949 family)
MTEKGHCNDIIGTLSDYIDGELSPELCQSLEDHLKDCIDCRVVVDTMKKTIELYKLESRNETLPLKVKERLYARLNLEDFKI